MKTNYENLVKSLLRLAKIDAKKATILRMQLAWHERRKAMAEINEILIHLPIWKKKNAVGNA